MGPARLRPVVRKFSTVVLLITWRITANIGCLRRILPQHFRKYLISGPVLDGVKSRKPRTNSDSETSTAVVHVPDRAAIAQAALEWYRIHGRDLPWRRTTDPYEILVSELMLQQTTVTAVIPYYGRFLARFPTPSALALAPEQDVMAQWAGLGYYRRARLLQSAARAVVEEHNGVFPDDPVLLQSLPGVGRYTAGAIASFAFDLPAPIVETNTARLMVRLFAIEGSLADSAVQRRLWKSAEALLPDSGGRDHNSALMDLGSMICTPVRPRCFECPLSVWCASHRLDLVDRIPSPTVKPEKLQRAFVGAVIEHDGKFLVRRIPAGEWHAGLFEFPKVPIEVGSSSETGAEAVRKFLLPYCQTDSLESFAELRYTVTKHAVRLTVWRGQAALCTPMNEPIDRIAEKGLPYGEFQWMTMAEIEGLPLGSAQRRLLRLMSDPNDLFRNGSK